MNTVSLTIIIYIIYLWLFRVKVICTDDGGWSMDDTLQLVKGPCDIDVVDSTLSQEHFLKIYAYKAPVIVKGNNHNTKFRDICRKHVLLQKYGDKIIRLSSANTHSYEKKDVTLSHYVQHIMKPQSLDRLANETFYWFGDNNHSEWSSLFKEYIPPKYTLPGLTNAYSFGVAAAGTGVPFHFHGPGFAEVVFGRKRWFVYPPDHQPHFDPNQTTLHWFNNILPELHPTVAPRQCTVQEGDFIYFPDHWWHATLNLDTSVFISTFLG